MTIKVKAIIGSTSSTSYNLKVVESMRSRYADRLEITPVFINALEPYATDIENNPSEDVLDFKKEVADSDAVLFAVPEYNFSIPGQLKNAIDWMSRVDLVLNNKPTFIVGASMGALGSVRAQQHLREILSNPNLAPALLPQNEVYIGSVHEKIDEAGNLTDEGTLAFLDVVVDNFIKFYEKEKAAAAVN
ncbi:NAD(P)H-dependent oxidoreductase [Bhargavaea ginsengi]|uniref:NADPH-dependent FMN reductase n=1 Tax=Bhargavaea ginsengi TaxID=426757 RepID=UPI00203C2FD0|nr:NADPH-dependent FMN reductase [Bhargavaea ginsengi]MCM3088381.1 NAD(P)H-dependent oxidoreductase [Bhargavaea ginsengi]